MTLDNETAVLSFVNAETTHWAGKPQSIASAAHLLNGGTANYVWRVQFESGDNVVVKFFPPFVRARPVVPFAQGRSELEHTALQLVQRHCERNARERHWSAPKSLFYDSEMHVLIMEYVSGEGLFELLKQTGAVSHSASERGAEPAQADAADSNEDVAWIAKTVMQFLIEIASLSPSPEQISAFHTSPLIPTMTAMFARVPTVASERYGLEPKVVHEWLARAAENESRIDSRQKLLFGDLWPNSLMVDIKRKHLYVVDWELARTGHEGVDFTQFVGNLVLMERAKSFDRVAVKALRVALLDEWKVWVNANPESTRFYYKESFLKRMLQLSQYYQEEISDLKAAVDDIIESSAELSAEPRQALAGVLIPLIVDHENDSVHVILTRRSFSLRTHPGEVALPGGRMDETDADISATALREAWEEIGLHPSHVRIVSTHESAISLHKLVVTPVCGIILDSVLQKSSAEESSTTATSAPTTTVKHDQILQTMTLNESETDLVAKTLSMLQINKDEVESAFAVPLQFFLSAEHHEVQEFIKNDGGVGVWRAHRFLYRGYSIFGLTAHFLVEFAVVALGKLPEFAMISQTERPQI
ncbi:hypothetical protein HDU81_010415 [Chytriomyces hyalinus]|nr:hypothetical protein HDU81_010415 [Chytriomyces hyalinus]